MLDCPPSRFLSPPHVVRFLRFRYRRRRLRSSSRILSLFRSVVPTLSPSRSIAFCVVFTLVALSLSHSRLSRFSQLSPPAPAFLLSSPAGGNFSVLAARTSGAPSPSISQSSHHTPSLSRIRFCHFIPCLSRSTPWAAPRDALYFHLTIILVLQILLALDAFGGETLAPARPVKFHYEINPGEYSYLEKRVRFFIIIYHSLLLPVVVVVATAAARSPFSTLSRAVINITLLAAVVSSLKFLLLF